MEILKIIFAIGLPCLVGYSILIFAIGRRQLYLSVAMAISFGLGFGVLTQVMLVMAALNLKYTVFNISSILGFISGGFILASRFMQPSYTDEFSYFSQGSSFRRSFLSILFSIIAVAIIVYYLIFSFWTALNIPVYTWDSFSTCIYNAKVIYFDSSLKSFQYLVHSAYPLNISMITAWFSFNLGQWNDQLFKIFFPLTLIAFVIIYNEFLKSHTNKMWALLGVLMLFSSNFFVFHSSFAYRDFPLMFYNCSVIIFLLMWKDQKQDSFLILAALFSGFGTFIKQEGTAYLLVHFLVMLFILFRYKKGILKEKVSKILKFLILSLGIFSLFYCYKIFQGISTTEYLHFNFSSSLHRIPTAIKFFAWALIYTANWNILWAFLVVSLFLNLKKIRMDSTIQTLVIAMILFFGLLISLSIIVGNNFIIHQFDVSRVILHFFPLCPLTIILIIYPREQNLQKSNQNIQRT